MILFLGDIHGNFEYTKGNIKRTRISDCAIFQVGDFGIGFSKPESEKEKLLLMNKFMKEKNIIMYVLRGNHDDPSYFNGEHIYSNLKLMPDYSVVEYDGYKILMIGGAISIDRKQRLRDDTIAARYGSSRRSYWFDEKLVLDEEKIEQIPSDVSILLTHTAPDWCQPLNKIGFGSLVESFAENDPNLLVELKDERELMSKIFNLVNKKCFIKNHYYGHFHRSDLTINGGCTHQLLGINEIVEFK